MMKPVYMAIAAFAALLGTADAASKEAKQKPTPDIPFENVAVERLDNDVEVSMNIGLSKLRPGRDREYTLTPTLYSPDGLDSVAFEPIIVSGHNLYYLHKRQGDMAFETIYKSGKVKDILYSQRVEAPQWVDSARLAVDVKLRNCCSSYPLAPIDLGQLEQPLFEPLIQFTQPKNAVGFLGPKIREIDGRAYINFPVNEIKLYPKYMNNPEELKKIIGTIDSIKNDKDITVDSIFIKGYASPEGSYQNNVRLAKGRTATLKDYVERMYTFPKGFIQTSYEPEDWEGLKEYVENSHMLHRDEILAIINSDLAPDPKNTAIQRRFPKEYDMLLTTEYPKLRHSDYSIFYTIRTFTDPKEIIHLMKTAPQKLSEEEVGYALSTVEAGTPESNDLYETAARMFPKNIDFCMGAANAAIERGDYKGAEAFLDKVGNTAPAMYARGVVAASQGDLILAKKYYQEAANKGSVKAEEALTQLEVVGDGKLRFVPVQK